MAPTRRSTDHLMPLVLVLVAGAVLWYAHAESWDLGGRSPILSYDSAQLALAARELAWHGRLATPFALPVDLVSHAGPPWPLSAVQPGLVLVEAAIFKLIPARGSVAGSDPRAWFTLITPFVCYLLLGALTVLATSYVLARRFADAPRWIRSGAPAALGLGVLLDVQAQHYALSGVGELPFTALLLLSLFALAMGAASEVPFTLGVFLGIATLFRATPWLAPAFALAAVWTAPPGRRLRAGVLVFAGYAALLAPWWFYKWRAFGSAAWDLGRMQLWDRIEDRSAFELLHRAQPPALPHGAHALALLAAKAGSNLPRLLPALLSGPRGLWLGALACWPFTQRGREEPAARALVAAALVLLAGVACETLAAAASTSLAGSAFPARMLAELAGTLALWSLLQRAPGLGGRWRDAACVAVALLVLGWGTWTTRLAHDESRGGSLERGVPTSRTLTSLSVALNETLAPGETIMCNLGPALAWQTNHPVIHLAWSPADVAACRQRYAFRHLLLVFRDSDRAWAPWQEIVERPGAAATHTELGVRRERRFATPDGFSVVWLELGPIPPQVAVRQP